MIQVVKGEPIGTFNLIVVEELPPIIHKNYKERQVKVICPICGEPFVTDLRRLMRTENSKKKAVRACPKCMQEYTNQRVAKLGKQSIKDLSNLRFGYLTALYPTEERRGNGYNVVWHCVCDCGTEVDVAGLDLQRGHTQSCGCVKSKGERKIALCLQNLNIRFCKQYTFECCINPNTNRKLPFDFYLPEHHCCIEYDGEQHYKASNTGWNTKKNTEAVQYRDNIKNQFCEQYRIPLIRIPYWDYNQIDERYITNLLHSI